jgi:hypothetical protein
LVSSVGGGIETKGRCAATQHANWRYKDEKSCKAERRPYGQEVIYAGNENEEEGKYKNIAHPPTPFPEQI